MHPMLRVLQHPLIDHKISLLRDESTPVPRFKELVTEASTLMVYEITRDLPSEEVNLRTPLEECRGRTVAEEDLVLVPILRAGLGMLEGFRRVIPNATVGHVGLYRDHDTLQPIQYYFKIPNRASERSFLVLDPMLATGGSAAASLTLLKNEGATKLTLVTLIAAPEGVELVGKHHPEVPIYTAALDRELNDKGYILPGLGDAGDRIFGTS